MSMGITTSADYFARLSDIVLRGRLIFSSRGVPHLFTCVICGGECIDKGACKKCCKAEIERRARKPMGMSLRDFNALKPSKPRRGKTTPEIVHPERQETHAVEASLPWPPSNNVYYRHNLGRTHISTDGMAYRRTVTAMLLRAGIIRGPVSLVVAAYPPDNRRRDLDNLLKALCDALTHAGVYEDDCEIAFSVVGRFAVKPGGEVRVRIAACPDESYILRWPAGGLGMRSYFAAMISDSMPSRRMMNLSHAAPRLFGPSIFSTSQPG